MRLKEIKKKILNQKRYFKNCYEFVPKGKKL